MAKDIDWARMIDSRQSADIKKDLGLPDDAVVWDWEKSPYKVLSRYWLTEDFLRSCRLRDPWTNRKWSEAAARKRRTGKRQPKPPMRLTNNNMNRETPSRAVLMTLKPAAEKKFGVCQGLTMIATEFYGRPITVWIPYKDFPKSKTGINDIADRSSPAARIVISYRTKTGRWEPDRTQELAEAAAREKAEAARQEHLRYKERELAQNKPEGWQRCTHGCGRALAPTWDDAVAYYEHAVGHPSECLRCRNARRPGMFPTKRIDR